MDGRAGIQQKFPFGECPKCKTDIYFGGDWEADDKWAWREYECQNCDFKWQEVYEFIHAETIDAAYHLDECGNPMEVTIEAPLTGKL